jgi:hypothetical protein
MDKRNQGQKTACAKFLFMDMLLAQEIIPAPSKRWAS